MCWVALLSYYRSVSWWVRTQHRGQWGGHHKSKPCYFNNFKIIKSFGLFLQKFACGISTHSSTFAFLCDLQGGLWTSTAVIFVLLCPHATIKCPKLKTMTQFQQLDKRGQVAQRSWYLFYKYQLQQYKTVIGKVLGFWVPFGTKIIRDENSCLG